MQLTWIHWILIIIGIIIIIWFVWWIASRQQRNNPYNKEYYTEQKMVPKDFKLYYFYHPSCIHCKQFMPTWERIKEYYQNNHKTIHTIDVTKPENENLRFYYDVDKYPTIILTTANKSVEYNGNRTMEDIIRFVANNVI